MVEPTESESKYELDRFCAAMTSIRAEIEEVEKGIADPKDNLLKNAPHTSAMIAGGGLDPPVFQGTGGIPRTRGPWRASSGRRCAG